MKKEKFCCLRNELKFIYNSCCTHSEQYIAYCNRGRLVREKGQRRRGECMPPPTPIETVNAHKYIYIYVDVNCNDTWLQVYMMQTYIVFSRTEHLLVWYKC